MTDHPAYDPALNALENRFRCLRYDLEEKISALVDTVDKLEDEIHCTNQRINKGLALRCYDIEQKIAEIEKKVWEKDD